MNLLDNKDKKLFDLYFDEGDMENNFQRQREMENKAMQQRRSSTKGLYVYSSKRFGNADAKVYRATRRRRIGFRRRRGRGIKLFKENFNYLLTQFLQNISPNNIYLVSDIHFYKNETKKNGKASTKKLMDSFRSECKKLSDNDVLIILGDIGHKENNPEYNEKIKDFFKSIKCNKILIKGNHDILSDKYYKDCGFLFVENEVVYDNIILSHIPVNINKYRFDGVKYNVHGHIHGSNEYYDVDGKNHFDVWTNKHIFLNLSDIIKTLRKEEVYVYNKK